MKIEDMYFNKSYYIGGCYYILRWNNHTAIIYTKHGTNSNPFCIIGKQIIFENKLYANKTTLKLLRRFFKL